MHAIAPRPAPTFASARRLAFLASSAAACLLGGPAALGSDVRLPPEGPRAQAAAGAKTLLVIRTDFSDAAGEPVPLAVAGSILTDQVQPFFAQASFGTVTLTSTVTSRVYRLPQTAAAYAAAGDPVALHNDARAAASADYDAAAFDLIMVVFPRLDTNTLAGTGFEFGGLAELSGTRTWINGRENFTARVLEHELGHNFGADHANSLEAGEWPVGASFAHAAPYGDTDDVMGSGDGVFNAAARAKLGWLPAGAAVVPPTGVHTIRLYASGGAGAKVPAAAWFTAPDGVAFWIYPRVTAAGTGVAVTTQLASGATTATIRTITANGPALAMQPGDYYSELGSKIAVAVQSTGVDGGVPYADCVFSSPAAPGAPGFTTVPSITDATSPVHIAAAADDPGATVTWQKRLAGSSEWLPLAPADAAAPPTATGLDVLRTTGIADVRCVAANGAGQIVSNPVRLLGRPLLSPASASVSAGAQRYFAAVTAAGAWTVTSDAGWLSVSPASGFGPQPVLISVAENTSSAERSASVRMAGTAHTVTQSAPDAETAAVFAAGAAPIGPEATVAAQPYQLGSGFTGMPSPGIFARSDGTRWAVGRQMMKHMSDDWMSTVSFTQDFSAGMGRLIRVPDDVAAFANDRNNGQQYVFVKRDGTVYVNYSSTFVSPTTFVAQPVGTGAVQLACGSTVASFVNAAGELWAWGRNPFGEVGDGTTVVRSAPVLIAQNATAISAATHQHWFVANDGELKGMGKECYSSLGTPAGFDVNVRKAAAGGVHTVILKNDGTVWTVGRNAEGQLGDGTWNPHDTPVEVASGIADVAAGLNTTYLLRSDGTLLSCGSDAHGELGDGLAASRNRFVVIDRGAAALCDNTYLKTDGTLWSTGGSLAAPALPVADDHGWVRTAAAAKQVAGGRTLCWLLDASGRLWASGRVMDGDAPVSTEWTLADSGIEAIFANPGSDWVTTRNAAGRIGAVRWTSNQLWARLDFGPGVTRAFMSAAGNDTQTQAYVLRSDGSLWLATWTMLPDGTMTVPQQISQAAAHAVSAAHDYDTLLYVDDHGTLIKQAKAGGAETVLGTGIAEVQAATGDIFYVRTTGGALQRYTAGPGFETIADGVATLALGTSHLVFQRSDGSVWTLGSNASGQLGPAAAGASAAAAPVLAAANADGFAAAANATLIVAKARALATGAGPAISVQPQAAAASLGQAQASFSAGATAATLGGTVQYRWQARDAATGEWRDLADGAVIAGASFSGTTLATLTVQNPATAAGLSVRCAVSSGGAAAYSSPAQLSLSGAAGSGANRLANLSTRAQTLAGEGVLTAGFVVAGDAPHSFLIRAAGPALAPFGVQHPLANPRFQIFSGHTPIMTNDDWGQQADPASVAQVGAALGAFPFADSSSDAALIATLNPGSYTVQATGSDGGTGIAMLEVYDAGADDHARIVNLSSRASVSGGEAVMISGIVVSGAPRRLLIRGVGPSLAQYDIAAPVPDPVLTVTDPHGAPIAANDNWSAGWDAAAVAAAAKQAGAFDLPSGSKDAALLITLPPGLYTAKVSDSAGRSGIALVEVYDVP